MIRRTVTRQGLLNISKKIRGERLDSTVLLIPLDNGIKVSSLPRESKFPPNSIIARFDQYNRVLLPEKMLAATGINRSVQIKPQSDGALLLLPTHDVCVICGSYYKLEEVKRGKFMCQKCRQEIGISTSSR